jgi:DNA repair exonuclease SbcCD ATPase subunit
METNLEKLEHVENLLTVLIEVVQQIEKKEIEIPKQVDYLPAFKELEKQLHQLSSRFIKADRLISAIELQRNTLKNLIDGLPKKIKADVEHRFSDKTRPYIIVFVVAIFIAAISIVGCISLLISNSDLKENDIKFRMVRLRKPSWAMQLDKDYFKNSDSLERLIKEEEQQVIAIQNATKEVQKQSKDIEVSRQQLKSLRQIK